MQLDPGVLNERLAVGRMAINDLFSPPSDANPSKRKRFRTLISVDDHLVEPPGLFEGRMGSKYAERTPRVIEMDDGAQAWLLDGAVLREIAINAVAGRALEERFIEPTRFDQLRRGTWDIEARISDMDIDGVYASLNFPSALGFAGVRLTALDDPAFALAVVRAWNCWHMEEWAGRHPERIIPCQIPYLHDAVIAAGEIAANAARGFRAVTFPEAPHRVGLPSLHGEYWDPFFAACEDTGTVVCIHAGSSGLGSDVDPAAPGGVLGPMFAVSQCLNTAIDWLYSRVPIKFPRLKVCLSEGGIGWVVGLMDRLDHAEFSRSYEGIWDGCASTPTELLRRNFWFCMLDDLHTLRHLRHVIGVENIVLEVDYPHSDASWPDTQEKWRRQFEGIPAAEAEAIAWRNASELFGHPVPAELQANPEAF